MREHWGEGALGGGSTGGWEHWGVGALGGGSIGGVGALEGGSIGGVGGSMGCGWEHGVWVGAWGVWVGAWGVWVGAWGVGGVGAWGVGGVGAWGVGGVGVVGATPLCMYHKSSSSEQLLFIESNLSSCTAISNFQWHNRKHQP